MAHRTGIGENVERVDSREKASGATRFVADLEVKGMWHGATVRAPVACGTIKKLVFSSTFNWSRVTVVTPVDIPGTNIVRIIRDDMPCLAEREVNYLGEPVALVCAETLELAKEAAANIKVEMEATETRPLLGIEEIARRYRENPASLTYFYEPAIRKGDVEAGFRESDVIVEGEYWTGFQEHVYLEPQGILVIPSAGGSIHIIGSLQCPYYVRPAVADVLGLPPEKVIVEQAPIGGAFGGKEDFPSLLAAHAALLALKAGRPVRIVYDRQEDISFTTKRHPSRVRHKAGVRRDGRIIALESEILFDAGAYVTLSPVVLTRGLLHACGVYSIPNARLFAKAVKSNVPPTGAFRGFGVPQTIFAIESHMDTIATRLGLSPLEVRRKNVIKPGDSMATGQVLTESVGASACLEAVAAASNYERSRSGGVAGSIHSSRQAATEDRETCGREDRGTGTEGRRHETRDTGHGTWNTEQRTEGREHEEARAGIQCRDHAGAVDYKGKISLETESLAPAPAPSRKDIGKRRGIGLSCFLHGATFTGSGELMLKSRAALKLLPSGEVEILCANTEMGQGLRTVLTQLTAHYLGISTSRVKCMLPDTSVVPNSGPTVASRSTMVVGRILELCSTELLTRMRAAIAGLPDTLPCPPQPTPQGQGEKENEERFETLDKTPPGGPLTRDPSPGGRAEPQCSSALSEIPAPSPGRRAEPQCSSALSEIPGPSPGKGGEPAHPRTLSESLGLSREGEGFRVGPAGKYVSWEEASRLVCGQTPLVIEKQYDLPPGVEWDETTFKGSAYPVYSWGAAAVEVEVDMATYEVTPLNLWLAYEIGKALNPLAVRGQLEGGSIQALGFGLMESLDLTKDGRFLQNKLQTYLIPTSADVPEIHLQVLEIPYSRGPCGAKGIGELPHNGVAPAVRNAVLDALGVEINSLPVTPEKICAWFNSGVSKPQL